MSEVLHQTQKGGVCLVVLLVLLAVSGCAVPPAKVALVNSKTGESVTCPEGFQGTRGLTGEQLRQHVTWHSEFQRTHNRLPTPMEGCLNMYEILGFVRVDPSVERLYTNPIYRWSISYPANLKVKSSDPGFVEIYSPAPEGLCGIHSSRGVLPFKTVDEFTDSTLVNAERFFKDRGKLFAILARRRISLPNNIIGNDVLTEIGPGGRSRRIYVLAEGEVFVMDCETYVKNWERLEPTFDRIIRSFTLGK